MPDTETAPIAAADSPAVPVADIAATQVAETPAPVPQPSLLAEIEATVSDDVKRLHAAVDLWFAECIQNTEIGRYTGAYNAAYAALGELKRRLAQEI